MSQPLTTDDRAMGQRVTRYREGLRLSQDGLAEAMRLAGFGWYQSTV